MAGKGDKVPVVVNIAFIQVVPYSFSRSGSSKKAIYGCDGGVSTKFTKSKKGGDFVDKCNGNYRYKEEVKYGSSIRFNDKIGRRTIEYQTQVNFKKVMTYNSPKKGAPKSSYKCITYEKY